MYIRGKERCITLPTGGKGCNKRFPDIIARLTEEAPAGYKEVVISRDGQSHYYASFVYEQKAETREEAGVLATDPGIFLDEHNTSKACSGCSNLEAIPLWKRTYRCEECGLIMDRDDNSAVNILMRFLAGLRPHTGEPVRRADVFTAIEHRCAEVSAATDQCKLKTFDYI